MSPCRETLYLSKLFYLVYYGVSVYVALAVESDAVIDAIGLGLSFKAERAVEYLLGVASECRAVAKEVSDIELYAGLIGVYR